MFFRSFSENYNNRVWKTQILTKKRERNLLGIDEDDVKQIENQTEAKDFRTNKVAPEE